MKKYIIALLLIAIIFNGFSNLREITDLAIVKVIGIDMTEDGEYEVSVIVENTTSNEEKEGELYLANGKSVQEAVRNIVDQSPKKLYLAHLETLIVSEDIAKNNFESTLDFFIRDNEGSNNFYLLISKTNAAKETIECIQKENIDMKELLLSSVKYKGNGNTKTLNDNLKEILKPGKDICVNTCTIEEGNIKIMPMAYFNGWNHEGYLTENESVIYNLLDNNIQNAIITAGKENLLIVAEIVESKSNIKVKNKAQIEINVEISVNISETGNDITLKNTLESNSASDILEDEIKDRIVTFIEKIELEKQSDVLGVGNLLYRKKIVKINEKNKEASSKISINNLSYNVEVNVKILNQGGVTKQW